MLVGLVVAMFAWDASREDLIADDVRVGPVDVSAMTRSEARAAIQRDLLEPLKTPLVVRSAGKPFVLSLREAQISADVGAMVDDAVERSAMPNSPWAGDLAGTVIPGGAPNNPIRARWLGIYDGVGVHGTEARGSIGSNASHGCIRMLVEDVEKLYDEVPVGTRSSSAEPGSAPDRGVALSSRRCPARRSLPSRTRAEGHGAASVE